ncbi:hypothetical protein BGZ61DRAFT_560234 [Ilyonectria robusta]|uniref:uncharacterized protein n=1 Tax=Ilyonectria robusta TaxID=1079257 RepID=UPI001E8D26EE|nr:uncharacterized protein BGZ61DRAFT_560234 [Ilyonectria robusta]KAH8734531.1 hypothetical protein BGZ61DRAFT_560234 [Ilyonectria robusta]
MDGLDSGFGPTSWAIAIGIRKELADLVEFGIKQHRGLAMGATTSPLASFLDWIRPGRIGASVAQVQVAHVAPGGQPAGPAVASLGCRRRFQWLSLAFGGEMAQGNLHGPRGRHRDRREHLGSVKFSALVEPVAGAVQAQGIQRMQWTTEREHTHSREEGGRHTHTQTQWS